MNEDEEFEKIDDIVEWFKDNNVKWKEVFKTAPVKILRKPNAGEKIKTIASDGTEEVVNTAKEDSWVVCNARNEDNFWLVRDKVLKSDYVTKDDDEVYRLKT
jgi:hypothetical protein